MNNPNISFNEQKKDLYYYLKKIVKFLKKDDVLKFDDLVAIILKSIRIIYSNPDKLLYHIQLSLESKIEENLLNFPVNPCESSEIPILSKEFKSKTKNTLLKLMIKVIYNLLKFIKNARFANFTNHQKYIYLHLIRHLIKECLFEMPLQFKNRFSTIFQVDLQENSNFENFYILRSLLLEIGDYEIIKCELAKGNYKSLAHGFIYFIKASEKKEISVEKGFDEIFEVFNFEFFFQILIFLSFSKNFDFLKSL